MPKGRTAASLNNRRHQRSRGDQDGSARAATSTPVPQQGVVGDIASSSAVVADAAVVSSGAEQVSGERAGAQSHLEELPKDDPLPERSTRMEEMILIPWTPPGPTLLGTRCRTRKIL